jgi:hypothetical protein
MITRRQIGWILIVSSILLAIIGFLMIDWSEWEEPINKGNFILFILKKAKIWNKGEEFKYVDVSIPEKCVRIEKYRPFEFSFFRKRIIELPERTYYSFQENDYECRGRVEPVVVAEVPWFTSYNWEIDFYSPSKELATLKIRYWREGIHYKNWLIFCVILAFIGSILVITYKPEQ